VKKTVSYWKYMPYVSRMAGEARNGRLLKLPTKPIAGLLRRWGLRRLVRITLKVKNTDILFGLMMAWREFSHGRKPEFCGYLLTKPGFPNIT
jgi:hypothetical protein